MASPSGGKDLPLDPRKAIQELMVGKEFAARVESRLREDTETAALMDVVIGSISRALSSLDPYSDEISGGKRKTSLSGDKRGCYKKRIPPSALRRLTSDTTDDGYIWRKYGQKDIQSAKYPRSYYRCLHKYGQGCQATRQVEKSSHDPSLFLITYLGEHTCKEPTTRKHLITYSSSLKEESLISFGSKTFSITQDAPLLSSSFSSAEVLSNLTPSSSFSDNIMVPNIGSFEDYGDMNLGAYEGSTHGAQNVGSVSDPSSLDMSFMIESSDYMDEMFSFDEGEFYFKDGEGAPFF